MTRITRNQLFMEMAFLMSQRSTCGRAHVGAVFIQDGRVVCTGYNGAPVGLPHCTDDGCEVENGCVRAVHAEANAISFAARHGIRLEGSTLYCTHAPCYTCAKLLVNVGITDVIYGAAYRDVRGLELLKRAGIVVIPYERMPSSG